MLKNNWKWKLFSLITGFLLWSYIVAGVNPMQRRTFNDINLVINNTETLDNRNLSIVSMDPSSLSVRIIGKRNVVGRIKKGDITASIDAAGLHEGVQTVRVRYDLPDNVSLNNDGTTERLSVDVQGIINRSLPVQAGTKGSLDKNYVLEKISVNPSKVPCKGVRSKIETVDHLEALIDLSGLTEDTSANVKLVPVDKDGNKVDGIHMSLEEVNLTARILKQARVPIKAVFTGVAAEGMRISENKLNPNEVLVKGKAESLENLKFIKTEPIDMKDIANAGKYTVNLNYPEGVEPVENIRTAEMDILMESITEKEISVLAGDVKVIGINKDFKAFPVDPAQNIKVKLRAFPSALAKIHNGGFELYCDFSHLDNLVENGLIEVSLDAILPESMSLLDLSPGKITFRITKK